MFEIPKKSFNPSYQLQQRVVLLENQLRILNNTLQRYFVAGRLRTDRTAPVDSNDVQPPDQLYDRVLTADYEYILINDANDLKWRRIALNTF